jgi:hypothetical protein
MPKTEAQGRRGPFTDEDARGRVVIAVALGYIVVFSSPAMVIAATARP